MAPIFYIERVIDIKNSANRSVGCRYCKLEGCSVLRKLAKSSPEYDEAMLTSRPTPVGLYGFLFHRDGDWVTVIVDDNMYMTSADWEELPFEEQGRVLVRDLNLRNSLREDSYRQFCQTGSRSLYFNTCIDQNETWLPLLEKAYAKAHGDYSALDWGYPGYGIRPCDRTFQTVC